MSILHIKGFIYFYPDFVNKNLDLKRVILCSQVTFQFLLFFYLPNDLAFSVIFKWLSEIIYMFQRAQHLT